MITTEVHRGCPYVQGEILSLSLAKENEPPGFVTFLSQGAAAGALVVLAVPVRGILSIDPFYGMLYLGSLPRFLPVGAAFGILEAIIIWACAYVTGRRLNVALRMVIALAALAGLISLFELIFVEPSPYDRPATQNEFLVSIGLFVLSGVIFGLLIGSRFRPLHDLGRGVSPQRWPVITAITGFLLRFAIVFFLMFSILLGVWSSRANIDHREFMFAVIMLSHFTAAAILVFVRMPFWLLLPLAAIINFPAAASIPDYFNPEDVESRSIVLTYLVLWAAFLSCRVQLPTATLRRLSKHV